MRLSRYKCVIEDDNGRYFVILLDALSTDDAKTKLRYILRHDSARIVIVREEVWL